MIINEKDVENINVLNWLKLKPLYSVKSDLTEHNEINTKLERLVNETYDNLKLIDNYKNSYIKCLTKDFYLGQIYELKCYYFYSQYGSGYYCDCCGKPITIFSKGSSFSTLCKECESKEFMEVDLHNYNRNKYIYDEINLDFYK